MKGDDGDVMASNINLGNELVSGSFFKGIDLKEDVANYTKVPIEKLLTKEEWLSYEI